MSNEPIEPQNFLGGVNVVDIGDIRVARGLTRRPASSCKHKNILFDTKERRIWCADCEKDVDPFDGFQALVEQWDTATKHLNRWHEKLQEAASHQIRSLAAREIDRAWQRRNMLPACPCCGEGLFPEDLKNGVGRMVNREWAAARRRQRRTSK